MIDLFMKYMVPRVSVLVPIYNVEKYIRRCAASLFEQSYHNLEYVFVNDCSPDNSIDVLKDVISHYPNRSSQIKIIDHDKNRGLAAARNTGVANCTGVFIVHVDSDDYLEPNAVELLVNQQLATGADIITGMALMHTQDKDILMPHPPYKNKEEMVLYMMQPSGCHSIWLRLIRKSLYEQHGISAMEGVNYAEDCWVMTRLSYYASSFSFIDEVVYHYDCTRDDSYMASNRGGINKILINDVIVTAEKIIDFFRDKELLYYEKANQEAVKFIEYNLMRAVHASDSELFGKLLTSLKAFDKKYWVDIGWDNSIKRVLSQNMYSCRVMLFLMSIYYRIQAYRNNLNHMTSCK